MYITRISYSNTLDWTSLWGGRGMGRYCLIFRPCLACPDTTLWEVMHMQVEGFFVRFPRAPVCNMVSKPWADSRGKGLSVTTALLCKSEKTVTAHFSSEQLLSFGYSSAEGSKSERRSLRRWVVHEVTSSHSTRGVVGQPRWLIRCGCGLMRHLKNAPWSCTCGSVQRVNERISALMQSYW